MTDPSVSVLMAVRNAMPYLPPAIESILHQSLPEFEFVIVDDGSTDETVPYLEGLRDPRICLLKNPGRGQTEALNFGLQKTRGTWVARMDGDDVSLPDRLEKQLRAAQIHPQAVLVSADYIICGEDLHPIAQMSLNVEHPGFLHYVRKKQNPFCHPVMMFHRETALHSGGYPQRQVAQDYALWLNLLERGPIAHVSEPLLKYRLHDQAVSLKRYDDQQVARKQILATDAPSPVSPVSKRTTSAEGMYAYRQGFAAWIAGDRRRCWQAMGHSLLLGTRVPQALAAIFLSLLPRSWYLNLTGYSHVYR